MIPLSSFYATMTTVALHGLEKSTSLRYSWKSDNDNMKVCTLRISSSVERAAFSAPSAAAQSVHTLVIGSTIAS